MVSISSPLAVVGFIDRDYRKKSVATQVRYNSGLAPIPSIGRPGVEPVPHLGCTDSRIQKRSWNGMDTYLEGIRVIGRR